MRQLGAWRKTRSIIAQAPEAEPKWVHIGWCISTSGASKARHFTMRDSDRSVIQMWISHASQVSCASGAEK
jgi:hypothetical protein